MARAAMACSTASQRSETSTSGGNPAPEAYRFAVAVNSGRELIVWKTTQ